MAFKLSLPEFKLSGKKVEGANREPKGAAYSALPASGGLSVTRKIRLLSGSLVVFFTVAAAAAYINSREADYTARYLTQSGKLLMLSQRLAKDAQLSALGDASAFQALVQSKENFAGILRLLDKGDGSLPATSGAAREVLNELMVSANRTLSDVQALEEGRLGLVTLGTTVAGIEATNIEFRGLTQGLIESASDAQKKQAISFALSTERVAKDTARALAADVSLEQLAALGIEAAAAEESLAALPAADPAVQRLAVLFEPYRNNIKVLNAQSHGLVKAKSAVKSISGNIDLVLAKSQRLIDAYQSGMAARISGPVAVLAGMLVLLQLLVLAKVYLNDSHQRAEEAENSNRRNQDAIQRLMNELSELAEGDLTVRATVSEGITGAIANAVNYTTEELRKLVARIMVAADQMGHATRQAEQISKGLLEAAQKQAGEIRKAGESVQLMAGSIREVDSSAARATEVGQRTLAATERGGLAVRNTIAGMDGIREQIQETSKRIKRLGESSQEIGEIVDLISDITELTNVLALNAAIQAVSAGEAGRGFSVVAEEVQRLAERSAEATKQIGTLVKTIQGDTQDAIAAMEKSTLGVVEGAKLSDVAGQSLKEIEQVSKELASLINGISMSTQIQTDMAGKVAHAMRNILQITQQATDGTRLTANSVAQLTNLSADLKGSVAGFKL
ncbi:MAG TPA: methyl-accepting chemotaxis protein [Gallionella sp.]|nr:methyl-accepting chemotaxis protein [Gallionella sp.]